MTEVLDRVTQAIQDDKPLVLVLGQHAWTVPGSSDSVLESALKRIGEPDGGQMSWRQVLIGSGSYGDWSEWLAERFERRVHPKSIEALGQLPWSAVFTSSLDPTLHRSFSASGREPEPILTNDEFPKSVRSKSRPPLYYLFSKAGISDPSARIARDTFELNTRRTGHAIPILNRLAHTVTPIGTVCVEGYAPEADWLRLGDLLGTVCYVGMGEVLWFGGMPDLQGDDRIDFQDAIDRGQITVVDSSLAACIAQLREIGRLGDLASPLSEDAGVVSFAGNACLDTPPELRLRVEAVASIVDDSWSAFLPPLGSDAAYSMFRRFHGHLEGPRLLVEGVRRGYAIQRDFESELLDRVREGVSSHASLDGPIVLTGQSSTGKSIALARIVARVREEREAAVLYAVGRVPQPEEVSAFCEAAEEAGARVTLIISDANRDVDMYFDLLMGLRSRGRRVVVLGSQYLSPESLDGTWGIGVEAPVTLTHAEQLNMADLLAHYVGRPDPSLLSDNNMLAFVYRFLPASRPRISVGLGDEAIANEQLLRALGKESVPISPISPLHVELIRNGFLDGFQPIFNEEQDQLLREKQDIASGIIDLVMVAGRLDCPVPLNLLLRAATSQSQDYDFRYLSRIFGRLGLFRWEYQDQEGNELVVGPRLILEADLICRRRLGSSEGEAKRLLQLVGAVRSGVEREEERRFLLNLLQQINPDGQRNVRYRLNFADFGRELTKIRLHHNVVDARLMLQESAFRRAAIRENAVSEIDKLPLLEEARDALQYALDRIQTGGLQAPRRTKQNLLVERAALYGFLATDRARRRGSRTEIWSSYDAARTAVRKAATATESYYPLDVGLWTPADLLDSADLSVQQRSEMVADIYATLDQVERDSLRPNQRKNFNERRMKVGLTLNNNELTEQAFEELEQSGSTAGYFLRARQYGPTPLPDGIEVYDPGEIAKAAHAAMYLRDNVQRVRNDPRCLFLLLEFLWIAALGRRPLRGERQPLPSDESLVLELLDLARTLNEAYGESARHSLRYLHAVLTWLSGDYMQARDLFYQVDTASDFENPSRVIKRHVITASDLKPRHFEGRVERARGEHDWDVRVEGISQLIRLRGRDFPHEQIAYGRTIRGFGIGFNFIGPIADPLR